jgi:hypothetical protein
MPQPIALPLVTGFRGNYTKVSECYGIFKLRTIVAFFFFNLILG